MEDVETMRDEVAELKAENVVRKYLSILKAEIRVRVPNITDSEHSKKW